ncbi:hypothetical protein JCM21900_003306 [Sporobolomyces salmonicolor]
MSWLNQPYTGGYGQPQYPQQPLQAQPTGYMPQLQPQRTGFAPQPQFQQPQPTGYLPAQGGMRPPVPMQPQPTGFAPPMPQMQRPVATGYGAGSGFGQPAYQAPAPLLPQPTGFNAGGLGAGVQNQFLSTFMPAPSIQPSAYMQPQQMQFAGPTAGGPSLQQSFQQSNQAQTGQATVPIPWALTPEEKKRYDQIFRAWDQQGTGFIAGTTSKEVFGQAGLPQDDLMAIWNLADVNDRGKLNIDEFHTAMGLIYRRLNGNPIPATLPPEMAPPSARDLEDSANFLTSLLKSDTNRRATAQVDLDNPQSRAKLRSFQDSAPTATRKDATVFRNDDDATPVYKSSSRHLNRDDVRAPSRNDSNSELDNVKRKLKDAQRDVDLSRDQDDEEEDLKEELRRINRKIQRVQDDLDDNRRSGRRTAAKDEERRMLERELLRLEHEDLPKLEKRLEEKEREKRIDRKKYALDRDDRNANFGRYGGDRDRDRYRSEDRDRYGSSSRYQDDDYRSSSRRESPERGYQRGTYDSYDRPHSPPRSRTPPPPPPPVPSARTEAPPPPPPTAPPPTSTGPPAAAAPAADLKSMSPAERQAFIRAEAQRRVQDRLRALGMAAPSSAPDTSIQERLEAEKAEAARKAAEADEQLKAKELERQAKLERERQKGPAIEQALQQAHLGEQAIGQVRAEISDTTTVDTAAARQAQQAAAAQLDAEAKSLAAQEEKLLREKAERIARVEQLQKEQEEAEENVKKARAAFTAPKAAAKAPPPPPASRQKPAPPPSRAKAAPPALASPKPLVNADDDFAAPPPRSTIASLAPAPAAPPAPSAPGAASPAQSPSLPAPNGAASSAATSPLAKSPSTNPFHRLQGSVAPSASAATSPAAPKSNPFFAATPAAPPAAPTPPLAPAASAPPKSAYRTPPSDDDDWDAPGGLEKDIDESDSDDEPAIGGARAKNAALAQNLFSGLGLSGGRPSSATPTPPTRSAVTSPAPGASASAGGAPPPPPPPPPPGPPAPPAAPRAPPANLGAAAGPPPSRGALLGEIQGGLRLRKAVTVDKSGPLGAGAVIGDASPPVQTYVPPPSPPTPPREPTPPPPPPPAPAPEPEAEAYEELKEPEPVPEPEPVQAGEQTATLPAIVDEDPLDAVDQSRTIRMRSLYTYEGQRDEDLSFEENRVILANPAKDEESAWWYGVIETSGKKGWIPKAYVEEIAAQPAKALYAYVAASEDEISFDEDEALAVVDTSDESWWKAEKNGVIGLVPAAYFQLNPKPKARSSSLSLALPSSLRPPQPDDEDDLSSDDDSDVESPAAESAEAREAERLRVLEAAGLLVREQPGSIPKRRRRPPPARPHRSSRSRASSTVDASVQQLIVPPESKEDEAVPEEDQEERMEDAYDLYQRAMREQAAAAPRPSLDFSPSLGQVSPPRSPSPSTAPSTTSAVKDAWHSTTNSFLSRVTAGRSRSGTLVGDKPRPVISSPRVPQSESGSDSRSSGAFGSSWASLIDPSALELLPGRERKRQEACYELIATEQSYVQSLQLVVEVFYQALQPVLPTKALQVIFANLDDILLNNTVFLSQLEDRQRESRLYINEIGDVIKQHMKSLDVYRGYCVNQANAARTLADLKVSDRSLKNMLDGLRVKNLELEHFLLEPMQRLTRYPLLINQILRYTDVDHPDTASLSRALQISEHTLEVINEAVRTNEDEEKLAYLSDNIEFPGVLDARLDLTAPTRLLGPRKILREGKVEKAKSHRRLNLYLFNDLLVFTESRSASTTETVYRYPVPLEESSVRERMRDESAFVVTYRGESINVRAETPRQALAWTRDIEQARRTCLAAVTNSRRNAARA